MTEGAPVPGLRDRKRAATRARIEAAAIDLVLKDGLEAATVEAISERADISARTFFNYYDGKDAAILGLQPAAADEEAGAQHAADAGDDPMAAVVGLLVATMGVARDASTDLHARRVEVLRRHPEIVSSQFAQLHARKNRLADQVRRILAAHERFRDDPDLSGRAVLVLALGASAVRAAVETWAESAPHGGSAAEPSEVDEVDEVEIIRQRALALIHSTLERLR
jgi:AcrR family transcriptional regulator